MKVAIVAVIFALLSGCAPSRESTEAQGTRPKMYQGEWEGYSGIYANPDEAPVLRSGMDGWELRTRSACAGYGRMTVEILVGPEGRVDAARVVEDKGHPCEPEAIRAARSITFTPGLEGGVPVTTIMTFSTRL